MKYGKTFGGILKWAFLASGIVACSSNAEVEKNAVVVGLLLPYTGTGAATSGNFERSVLYAIDRINAAGGVKGRPIRIVARDTHSDLSRATQAANELVAEGATVVLGPESADIAPAVLSVFDGANVPLVSPVIGPGADPTIDCSHPWFRLAPSAQALGEALAKLAYAQGSRRLAIVHSSATYDNALETAIGTRFASLGGTVAAEIAIDANAQSYVDVIPQITAAGTDDLVLASSPASAAILVNEYSVRATKVPRWFLSPLLKTEFFSQNVIPVAIEGAYGVAPLIFDTSTDFATAFGKRWGGDVPLEGAYFYYDAVAFVGLALQNTTFAADGKADYASLKTALVRAAGPPGAPVGWNEIESGLASAQAGSQVYYSGLTGPLFLNTCGVRRSNQVSNWTVKSGSTANVP